MFIIFAAQKNNFMEIRKLNDLEAEFIDAVRNYKKAYPNGAMNWNGTSQGFMKNFSKEIDFKAAPSGIIRHGAARKKNSKTSRIYGNSYRLTNYDEADVERHTA